MEETLENSTMTKTTTVTVQNKDLKVRIPVKYHMQLHTLKILRGKSLSDAVTEALDEYFAKAPLP